MMPCPTCRDRGYIPVDTGTVDWLTQVLRKASKPLPVSPIDDTLK